MNVTKREIKYRKLNETSNEALESCLQMVSAERKEYAEAYDSSRITENNVINTDLSTEVFASEHRLLEQILDKDNMNLAFKKVKSNKGAGGIDKMGMDELLPYLKPAFPEHTTMKWRVPNCYGITGDANNGVTPSFL